MSERVSDQCFKSQLTLFRSYRDGNKVYQARRLGLRTRSCLYVWICTGPVLCYADARPVFTVTSELKHHATGRQCCANLDHYADSEPPSRSLTPVCCAVSRAAAETPILTLFVCLFDADGDRTTSLLHARRTLNHYTTLPW